MDIQAAARIRGLQNAPPVAASKIDETDGSFLDKVMKAAGQTSPEKTAGTQALSLEEMLKAKYPRLVYHVFDASSRYWQTREDYPFHLLYQEKIDTQALENWEPSGPNPSQISFGVQRNLASIPPGSKAVIIHPKVQERMEQDPAYANEIMHRIDAWFAFDVARNEAIIPGITAGMSQSIAIGEDGSIVNVQSGTEPGAMKTPKEEEDKEPGFWELRANRHAWYMELWQQKQIAHSMEVSKQFYAMQSSQTAKTQVLQMLNSEELKKALGDTIAGVSIEKVFEQTRQDVFANPFF